MKIHRRWGWTTLAAVSLAAVTGCASNDVATRQDMASLEERVSDLERSIGRWHVQVNELETELLIVADRVEAQRVSLERGGVMQRRSVQELPAYEAPPAQPDYSYLAQLPVEVVAPATDVRQDDAWDVRHDDADLESLVITNDTLAEFVESGVVPRPEPAQERHEAEERSSSMNLPMTRLEPDNDPAPSPQVASPAARQSSTTSVGVPLYESSLADFNAGRYQQALQGFNSFLSEEPQRDYADNAHYWIGECYYASGDYSLAVESFQTVVQSYPDGNKVADSLLKLGLTYELLNNLQEASAVLADLIENYPSTDAARRASERLTQMN